MKLPTQKCRLASMFFSKNLWFFGGNIVSKPVLDDLLQAWWTPWFCGYKIRMLITPPVLAELWEGHGTTLHTVDKCWKNLQFFFYFCRDGRRLLDDVFVKQLKVPNNKITTPQHFCIFHLFKGHEASIQKQNHSNIQLGPFFDYNHLKFKLKSICWGVSLKCCDTIYKKNGQSQIYMNDFPLWMTKCKTHSLLTIK